MVVGLNSILPPFNPENATAREASQELCVREVAT